MWHMVELTRSTRLFENVGSSSKPDIDSNDAKGVAANTALTAQQKA